MPKVKRKKATAPQPVRYLDPDRDLQLAAQALVEWYIANPGTCGEFIANSGCHRLSASETDVLQRLWDNLRVALRDSTLETSIAAVQLERRRLDRIARVTVREGRGR